MGIEPIQWDVKVLAAVGAKTADIPFCNVYSTIFPPSNRPEKSWHTSSILFPAALLPMILMICRIPGVCFVPMVLLNFSVQVHLPLVCQTGRSGRGVPR